jgi:hypothetical protein
MEKFSMSMTAVMVGAQLGFPAFFNISALSFKYFSKVRAVILMKSAFDTECRRPHMSRPLNGTMITAFEKG